MKYLILFTIFNTVLLIISFSIQRSDTKLFELLNYKIKLLQEWIEILEKKVDNERI